MFKVIQEEVFPIKARITII